MKSFIPSALILLITFVFGAFAQEEPGPVFGNGELPDVLQAYDANTNGVLEANERAAMAQDRRNARANLKNPWDANNDGRLDQEEREAARDALRAEIQNRRNGLFNHADLDGDGDIVLAEFSAIPSVARFDADRIAIIFDRLDADDDGSVDLEEFLAHIQNRHGAPGGPPANPGPPDNPGPPIPPEAE